MKILFLTDNFPPEVNAPATRTFEHAREWVKLGVEVTIITCAPNFPNGKLFNGYKNKLCQNEVIDGIKVIRVWSYITANEGFIKRTVDFISFSIASFIAGLFQKSHIIIATSPQFFTALAGRSLSFWKRTPWIMEVRDLWPESIKTVGAMNDNIFIRYLEKEEIWCYRSAAKIITVTDSFKNYIVNKGISENKLEVIKNGVDLTMFKPMPKDIALLNHLNINNKIVIGYIGTLGMAHKLEFILECAQILENSNYHFLIIGDGANKKKLKNILDLKQIKNVTILDAVPKEDIRRYISVLDISLITLKKSELFKTVIPSKIFENAAMGIPILLGVDGESRAIIEKYSAGLFFEPESKVDFLVKLNSISDINRKKSFEAGGRALATDFDRCILAAKMLEAIKAVAKK